MQHRQDEFEIDLREIFHLLKRKILIIIIAALICAVGSGIFSSYVVTPMYSSTSKIYILTQSTSITSIADIQVGSSLTLDYMELIKSRPVVEEVTDNLKLNMTYEEVIKELTVVNPEETRILNITITDADPHIAKLMAEEFAAVAKKQISEIMKTDEPSIVETANTPEKPVSPDVKRNILIGLLLGALIAALIIIVRYITDDTIKNEDDVMSYLGLETLAAIPLRPGATKQKKKDLKKGGKDHDK